MSIADDVRQSLGEMATVIPVSGSFTEYASRFVDDSLAFALGWAYWWLWVTVSIRKQWVYDTADWMLGSRQRIQLRLPRHRILDTGSPAMGLDPHILGVVPSSLESGNSRLRRDGVLAFSVSVPLSWEEQLLTIGSIKVLALIVFFILAICISAGGIGGQTIGFKYWHDPGAFADGINGVAKTFVVAGTLYAGTEM